MTNPPEDLIAFLMQLGAKDVSHSGGSFVDHLTGTYRCMKESGCSDELCLAGLFHSIYGTEAFQKIALPLERRLEVKCLIGERAEKLAYWNCAMKRDSFDAALSSETEHHAIIDRFSGEVIELLPDELEDLCRVHFFDWLEQASRSGWWRPRRDTYRRIAAKLGSDAVELSRQVLEANPQ